MNDLKEIIQEEITKLKEYDVTLMPVYTMVMILERVLKSYETLLRTQHKTQKNRPTRPCQYCGNLTTNYFAACCDKPSCRERLRNDKQPR